MTNMTNWFEIPVTDLARAKKFYSEVMQVEMTEHEMAGIKMAFFPHEDGVVSGGLCQGEMYKPSTDGTVVYLNCEKDLTPFLERVEPAGGKIIVPKTLITEEIGYFAMFIDSEGNSMAFHSFG